MECRLGTLSLTLCKAPTQGPIFSAQEKYWRRVILCIGTPVSRWTPRSIDLCRHLLTYHTQGCDQALHSQACRGIAALGMHRNMDLLGPTCTLKKLQTPQVINGMRTRDAALWCKDVPTMGEAHGSKILMDELQTHLASTFTQGTRTTYRHHPWSDIPWKRP